ncbi:uncharacterized protein AMSG_08404 [Thecamonas trahens ATCC 50062]|uniref:ferroxidase n=1 Tax=Thecamonas trahens ATCC 50062 TaxID=461836 RepID=A0A0L0DK04_THETB|nr:hypothetical protein AMSG_08404 [Thecamonas trahens ATCC 50062]KNC52426.1 hypothetical protein AMSG_08404 [Thecamonas trahens ATCC 50062]|eukprot:XP_013755467.1 hypothetical protein AMSG_08404 [Thecamonas trahens ATCC 50062]
MLRLHVLSSATRRCVTGWLGVDAGGAARTSWLTRNALVARSMAATPPGEGEEYMDMNTYHAVADETLEMVQEAIETVCDELGLADVDSALSQGVLNVAFEDGDAVFVLNKQTPNQQIWLSSPISGPMRFNYDVDAALWRHWRTGHELANLLRQEFSQLASQSAGKDVIVDLDLGDLHTHHLI